MQNVPMMDCADGTRRADNGSAFQFPLSVKTASFTVKKQDTGKAFSNKGAAGTVVATLPAAVAGLRFFFFVVAAQTFTVTASGGAKINNSAANGTYSAAGTQAGFGWVEVVCEGTNWYVRGAGTWTTT